MRNDRNDNKKKSEPLESETHKSEFATKFFSDSSMNQQRPQRPQQQAPQPQQAIKLIADALTAADIKAFSRLTKEGLIKNNNRDEHAAAIISNANKLTQLVLNDVLNENNLVHSVNAMEKWVNVAHYLAFEAKTKNYHSCKAIFDALDSQNINRLHSNKAKAQILSDDASRKLAKLRSGFGPTDPDDDISKNLKRNINSDIKSVPVLMVYIGGLDQAQGGNKDINMQNEKMSNVIAPLMKNIDFLKSNQEYKESEALSAHIESQNDKPAALANSATTQEKIIHTEKMAKYNSDMANFKINSQNMIPPNANATFISDKLKPTNANTQHSDSIDQPTVKSNQHIENKLPAHPQQKSTFGSHDTNSSELFGAQKKRRGAISANTSGDLKANIDRTVKLNMPIEMKIEKIENHIIKVLNDCELDLLECPDKDRRSDYRQVLNRIQLKFDNASQLKELKDLPERMKVLVSIGDDLSMYSKALKQKVQNSKNTTHRNI